MEVKPLSSNARFKQSRFEIVNPLPVKAYYVASSGGGKGGSSDAPVEGALLIFLPGVGEISRMCSELQRGSGSSRLFVVPLHGALPPADQSKAFRDPPHGLTKVVVATNIAETSLTLDGISYVIDAGYCKLKVFNPKKSNNFSA